MPVSSLDDRGLLPQAGVETNVSGADRKCSASHLACQGLFAPVATIGDTSLTSRTEAQSEPASPETITSASPRVMVAWHSWAPKTGAHATPTTLQPEPCGYSLTTQSLYRCSAISTKDRSTTADDPSAGGVTSPHPAVATTIANASRLTAHPTKRPTPPLRRFHRPRRCREAESRQAIRRPNAQRASCLPRDEFYVVAFALIRNDPCYPARLLILQTNLS